MPGKPTLAATFQSLRLQVKKLRDEERLSSERGEAFPFWVCQALLADPGDSQRIKKAIVGGSNDRNVDILFTNSLARVIYIGQTKYRNELLKHAETPNDVKALAQVLAAFASPREQFLQLFKNATPEVRAGLNEAWGLVRDKHYSVRALYVTTGRVSAALRDEAQSLVENHVTPGGRTLDLDFLVYDGRDCCRLQVDLQDLVPAIPYVDLVKGEGRQRIGGATTYSYVLAVPTQEISKMFRQYDERLFARNIRLSKGDKTQTNREILRSLTTYPDEFLYLNNGITILAASAEPRGEERLRIYQPQIINGQQTTRMIAAAGDHAERSRVLVRVIVRSGDSDSELLELRQFVRRVVRATNFQNRVKLSELAANNPEHIRIERGLRTLNWKYIRKMGKKSALTDDGWSGAAKPFGRVTLQELATALVACLHDPQYVRQSGIETVFEGLYEEAQEVLYKKLYPPDGREAEECLFVTLCYFLAGVHFTVANSLARSVENHGRYYIAFQMYELLKPVFRNLATRRGLLTHLGSQSYHAHYSEPVLALRKAVGRAWQDMFKKHGGGDVRAFVGTKATKRAWQAHFSRSKTSAASRQSARAALKAIRHASE